MSSGKLIKGYLAVIISAILYGCMPLMAKYIYADGVNPMTLVFLRNFLALPFIAAMAYGQNRTLRIPLKMLPRISLTSLNPALPQCSTSSTLQSWCWAACF